MSKKIKKNPFIILKILIDILLILLTYYLAYYIRHKQILNSYSEHFVEYRDLFIYAFIIQAIVYSFTGLYKHRRPFFSLDELKYTFNGVFYSFIITAFMIFASKAYVYSRATIFMWYFFIFITISFSHFILSRIESTYYSKGYYVKNVIIIGVNDSANEIKEKIEKYPAQGMKFTGFVSIDKINKPNVLGTLKELPNILRQYNINEIIIVDSFLNDEKKLEIAKLAVKNKVNVLIISNIFELMLGNISITELYGIPTITLAQSPMRGFNLVLKRLIDVVFSLLILIIGSPFFTVIAIAIIVDSKGPIFFKQLRVTKNGKIFKCLKFRSMVKNAEELKKELTDLDEKKDGPIFKIKNDPRITKVGKFLRKYSLDEFPQFINVLLGDMSIVGPRPPIPEEVEEYTSKQMNRLDVKQGLTGLWQVSGRSELSFEKMVSLDIYYIEHWSLWLDIKIILKTIPAIITSKGAY